MPSLSLTPMSISQGFCQGLLLFLAYNSAHHELKFRLAKAVLLEQKVR